MPESAATLPHDESDHESIEQLLSPSNGYFSDSHIHPSEVLVPVLVSGPASLNEEQDPLRDVSVRSSKYRTSPSDSSTPNSTQMDAHPNTTSQASIKTSSPQDGVNLRGPDDGSQHLMLSAPPAYSPLESGCFDHHHDRDMSPTGRYDITARSELLFPGSIEDMGGETAPLLRDQGDKRNRSYRLKIWWNKNSYKVFKYVVLTLTIIFTIATIIAIVLDLHEKIKV